MNNLLTAIYTKLTGSTLISAVGGRMFTDVAPQGAEYPYVVISIVNAPKERTFTEEYRRTAIDFGIFSISKSLTEITDIYSKLSSLFDECALSITGSTLVWCRETDLTTMFEDHTTPQGTVGARHWNVEFEIYTSLN